MKQLRLMVLDVGERRIGIALSDALGWTAQGYGVLERTEPAKDYAALLKICQEQEVGKIVVGLPKNMNGTVGPQGEKVKAFVAGLQMQTELPIVLWDERLTTVAAEKVLLEADLRRKDRKKVIDQMAATLILQSFLNSV